MKILNKNSKNINYVWWYDPQSGERDLAGVASYIENSGNYRLTLNFFPDTQYKIQAIGYENKISHYRIVSFQKNNNSKRVRQFKQGTGFLDQVSGEILIKTAPFNKYLILTPKENYEKRSA